MLTSIAGVVIGQCVPSATPSWVVGLSSIGPERLAAEIMKVQRAETGLYSPMKFDDKEWGLQHWSKKYLRVDGQYLEM